ncbi:MAG: T9SS type A sorting domain-containing protein [Bacteroidetes bacterium]|nr:T9SS type A sorting domain-containing protein [Bacteroidota bacterium]
MLVTVMRAAVRTILLIALSGVAAVQSSRMYAQGVPQLDPAASGKYFVVAFPDTVHNTLDVRYPNNRVQDELTLWLFSSVGTKVTIISGVGTVNAVQLAAHEFTAFKTSAFSPVITFNQASRNTLRVMADTPIVVYSYVASIQGLEAWTPIPVDRWGTSYRVASLPGTKVENVGIAGETTVPTIPAPAPATALVIAGYDGTHVSFHPPNGTMLNGNPPLSVTLNEGEAFQIASIADTSGDRNVMQEDIAGMEISADKPIGVISGNTRTQTAADSMIGGPGFLGNAYKGMQMEWLAPVDQYGMHFMHTPTWDEYRPGLSSRLERSHEFVRVYNPTKASMNVRYRMTSNASAVSLTIPAESSRVLELASDDRGEIVTDAPAQVIMHSSSTIGPIDSTPCFRGIPCKSYSGLAGYMASETPREQWTTFAPYYAPANPAGMQHYINVVTDTNSASNIVREDGSPFPFTGRIPGTDLTWGSTAVTPGQTHWLQGRNGARFAGMVYGLTKGFEDYRPGATRRKDDGVQVAGAGAHAPNPQHPCEYEEYSAVSYGYPLAPRRNVVAGPSSVMPGAAVSAGYQLDAVRDGENVHIRYAFPEGLHGALGVYDILGRQVTAFAAPTAGAGDHNVLWNTQGMPAGTYYITLGTESGARTIPIVVTR